MKLYFPMFALFLNLNFDAMQHIKKVYWWTNCTLIKWHGNSHPVSALIGGRKDVIFQSWVDGVGGVLFCLAKNPQRLRKRRYVTSFPPSSGRLAETETQFCLVLSCWLFSSPAFPLVLVQIWEHFWYWEMLIMLASVVGCLLRSQTYGFEVVTWFCVSEGLELI